MAIVGFLYGPAPETRILAIGALGKFVPEQQNNQTQRCIPRKPRKTEAWVSGAEIKTLAVDTRTAVWVSTLVARAIRNAIRANRFARIIRN